MKRVLLIVPDLSLTHARDEIQAVVNSGLAVRLLNNNVAADAISNELLSRDYEVLWFATHADATRGDGRVALTNEQYISSSELVQMVRGTKLELIYLNTCSSFGIASAIQEETDLAVICTINEVDDYLAYRTGAIFARRLARMKDYRSAFEAAKPGRNRDYLFLSSYKRWRRVNEEILQLLQEIKHDISAIASYLGLQSKVDEQLDLDNGRRIFYATIAAAALVSFSIMFLAFWLAG